MKAIDINFATVPLRNNTPYWLGYGISVLLLGVFTFYNGWALVAYSKSKAELESDYDKKKTRLESLYAESGRLQESIKKKDVAILNERASFTNKLLDNRRFSWTALLNKLEEVQPYQVRLLSLRPVIQPNSILIEARAVAKDLKAFWNFQQNLQNHPSFRRVYPGGYLKNNELGEIIFNIAFNYFPDGAPTSLQALPPADAGPGGFVEAPGPGGWDGSDADEGANPSDDEPALPAEAPPPAPRPTPSRAAQTPPPRQPSPPAQPPPNSPLNRDPAQAAGRGPVPGSAAPTVAPPAGIGDQMVVMPVPQAGAVPGTQLGPAVRSRRPLRGVRNPPGAPPAPGDQEPRKKDAPTVPLNPDNGTEDGE